MSDERLPRYQRLRDAIAERIAENAWRAGEAIPTEAELAKTHKVAVGTVRKAIDVLVADGLLERQQGRGTFVRRPSFQNSLFRFFRHQGRSGEQQIPESRILERKSQHPIPGHVIEALKLPKSAKAIRLSRLRLFGDAPFLLEEIWLPHARFARLLNASEAEIGPLLYPAYERLCGEIIARAEEVLMVDTAGERDSRLLGVAEQAPIVRIERLAFGFDNKPVEWRRSHGLATTFRYQVEIR